MESHYSPLCVGAKSLVSAAVYASELKGRLTNTGSRRKQEIVFENTSSILSLHFKFIFRSTQTFATTLAFRKILN